MTDRAEDRDPLDLLAEEFTAALRRGERPDVEAWARDHPEHADAIRELFPTIVAMEGVKEATRASRPVVALPGAIERLGDFRIVGEIGRGGMGVVYEAEQESLGRRVALKVLPRLRDPRRQHRFERETRMAARLHHTNIVPVYGVGEAEGFSYYVMPVIRGVGLDRVIAALRGDAEYSAPEREDRDSLTPTEAARALRTGRFRQAEPSAASTESSASREDPGIDAREAEESPVPDPGRPFDARARYWRSVADIGRQVADALAHAHHLGVMHRDVKPANLLLDAQGDVWVTDFGLAKVIGHDAALTHSGDLVGTLQYMAPEQLHGAYDARSDLHALGLTLYELLTLTPAYAASDRGTLLKRVAESSPTRPGAIRPSIPRDLETIVLKSIQPDPAHRYQTAEELRSDLEAFLEDRPIRARRATALEHSWRWCRRNKLVASLAAVTLITIVGAAITGWSAWATTRSALEREAAAAKDARQSSARAEANLALARQVFEGVFDRIAGPDRLELIVDETGEDDESAVVDIAPVEVSEADAALLEELLGFYDRFAASNADDAELRLDAAKAYRRVADIQMQLRRADAAVQAYERALTTFVELDDGTNVHAVTIASLRNDLGRALWETREHDAARVEFEQALSLLASAGESAPAQYERARSHESLARTLWPSRVFGPQGGRRPLTTARREMFERALRHQREAYRIYGALAEQQPDNVTAQLARVRAGFQLGFFLSRDPEGPELRTANLDHLENLARAHPDIAAYRRELLRFYELMTMSPRRMRDESASGMIDRAIELASSLNAESPDNEDYRRSLARALWIRAERQLPRDPAEATPEQLSAAHADLSRALSLDDALWPARLRYIAVLDALGRKDLATAELERTVREVERSLGDEGERNGRSRRRLGEALRSLARWVRARGDGARADELERKADELGR